MPKDRVQREIEEILDKLDTFVPEERFTAKMRARHKEQAAQARTGPTLRERITRPFTRITLGHLLIAGIILFAVSYLFDDQLGSIAIWLTVLGVVLAGGALAFSVINGGNTRLRMGGGGGRVQKRWRGQVIEYSQPGPVDRVRGWWRKRRGS